jgi:DNA-binding response OmpR family regulator
MTPSTPSVLVVEDESSIASFVALYLKNAGYAVQTVANGSDALSAVAMSPPSLIVLDLMLPDIDGIGVRRVAAPTSHPHADRTRRGRRQIISLGVSATTT